MVGGLIEFFVWKVDGGFVFFVFDSGVFDYVYL